MKKLFNIFILLLAIAHMTPSHSWGATASVEVIQCSDKYHSGKTYPVIFRIRIIEGWYIHSNEKGTEGIIPSALTFNGTQYLKVKDIRFPEPLKKKFDYLTEPIETFSNEILVGADVAVEKDTPPGEQNIKGEFSYQACSSNSCRPPENLPVDWTLTIVSMDTPRQEINQDLFLSMNKGKDTVKKGVNVFDSNRGLLWTLLLIFLGGLALNLSPCIYPMIPITVSYFGGKSGRMKGDTLVHGVMYLIGLSVTNSILGVVSALSGNMLGSVLQHPAALIAIAMIMTLLGLSFFDLWELRVPSSLNKIASRNFSGYFGTFFMGLTLGIIAAPCIGPFILGLFAYVGQKGDPFFGFLCFFILSMGMGLPICILALFSGAMKRLPLSGDWMLWIRKLMGWVLIGMAVYMISPLISGRFTKSALFLVTAMASGIHLGWLEKAGQSNARFIFVKRISGILIVLVGIGYLLLFTLSGREGIRWAAYDEGLLAKAAQEGKPVIIDFYADWCIPCKWLDSTVFRDEEVVGLSEKFVVMRMDLTKKQSAQDGILERYHVIGVPTIIFINKDGQEEKKLRVESKIGKDRFLSAMKLALLSAP
jgi:thioredoxin:protein disulfide reductase